MRLIATPTTFSFPLLLCFFLVFPGVTSFVFQHRRVESCHLKAQQKDTISSNPLQAQVPVLVQAQPESFRRKQQERKQPPERRPKNYWANLKNVKTELKNFWSDLGISSVCIPNEALLNHFRRNDIRAAIVTHGGREELAAKLGKRVTIMPGRWKDAVRSSPEVKILLKNETLNFFPDRSPSSIHHKPIQKPSTQSTTTNTTTPPPLLWSHQPNRKPKGYWNTQTVIIELYNYLDDYQTNFSRPAIWMPRPEELVHQGRADLKMAMRRFGGTKRISQMAGLIPYRDWNFFEGQYEFLIGLQTYLQTYHPHEEELFPCVSEIQRRGYDRLYLLIQYYGGRNFLSSRLGMAQEPGQLLLGISWGNFSLEFAIRLCEFIRRDHMAAKPPVNNPVIMIPSPARLRRAGEEGVWLHSKILEFGGYENVARRLYLGYRFQ